MKDDVLKRVMDKWRRLACSSVSSTTVMDDVILHDFVWLVAPLLAIDGVDLGTCGLVVAVVMMFVFVLWWPHPLALGRVSWRRLVCSFVSSTTGEGWRSQACHEQVEMAGVLKRVFDHREG